MADIEKFLESITDGSQRTSFEKLDGERINSLSPIKRRILGEKLRDMGFADPHERSAKVDSEAIRTESWQKELSNGSAVGAYIEMAAGQIGQREDDN